MAKQKTAAKAATKSTKKPARQRAKRPAKAAAKKPANQANKTAAKARHTASSSPVTLLVGTYKGGFIVKSDPARKAWSLSKPHMFSQNVLHMVADPRQKGLIIATGGTGHLGPTVYRSTDGGKTFKEAKQPPRFPNQEGVEKDKAKAVKQIFWFTPGHASQPGVWFVGVNPFGMFRSDDGGDTWSPVDSVCNHPRLAEFAPFGGVPVLDQIVHSILVDPRDANHMYFGVSCAGVFETHDGGKTWPLITKGMQMDFMPDKNSEVGHDVHCLAMSPNDPDIIWQQNHCGVYRLDRREGNWVRVGKNFPKDKALTPYAPPPKESDQDARDTGFCIATHPRHADTAWVFPMDAAGMWPRVSPQGKPAVYKTVDGGRSWKRKDKGFPKENAYLQVKRQAMAVDTCGKVGVYVGTDSGELWASTDEGESFTQIASHLPPIRSVEVM